MFWQGSLVIQLIMFGLALAIMTIILSSNSTDNYSWWSNWRLDRHKPEVYSAFLLWIIALIMLWYSAFSVGMGMVSGYQTRPNTVPLITGDHFGHYALPWNSYVRIPFEQPIDAEITSSEGGFRYKTVVRFTYVKTNWATASDFADLAPAGMRDDDVFRNIHTQLFNSADKTLKEIALNKTPGQLMNHLKGANSTEILDLPKPYQVTTIRWMSCNLQE
jgi:hypothetical protein